ncbi:MAG TPA: hypothetical protein VM243_01415 [Phycisphaerae bacterium]|nr:hypothetical protein [Phycisphaerae bacterium]
MSWDEFVRVTSFESGTPVRWVLARARLVPVALGLSASGGVGYAHPRLRGAFLYPYNLAPDHLQGVRFAEIGVLGAEKRGIEVKIQGREGAYRYLDAGI